MSILSKEIEEEIANRNIIHESVLVANPDNNNDGTDLTVEVPGEQCSKYDKFWYKADKESSIDSTNSLRVSFNSETSQVSRYSYTDSELTNIPTGILSYAQG